MQKENLVNSRKNPNPGQLYRHFKGNLYQIVAVAEHTETAESMVVYQALYGTYKVYVRPLDMFMSEVDRNKYPEVSQVYRFEQVNMGENAIEEKTMEVSLEKPDEIPKPQLDEGIWEFLDADSFEERLRVFTGMQHRLTDEMINIMAAAMDTEVSEGNLSERIASLKNYLLMQVKFECNRIR